MSQVHRLDSICRIAKDTEQKAAQKLAEAQSLLAVQQQELTQLEIYREEYAQQLIGKGRQGQIMHLLAEHQRFIQQIHVLKQARQRQLSDLENRKKHAWHHWQKCRSRLEALELLIQRDLRKIHNQRLRREQETMDEIAQRGSSQFI